MSFARRQSVALTLLLAATFLAGTAGAAGQLTPRLSGFHARVAKGGKVDLAASTLTTAELAALRPDCEKLKPRARSNSE